MSDELKHYGTPRHSGRYPWGSGDNAYQRNTSLLGHIDALRKQGVKETDIAKGMGMNTSELRKKIALATAEKRADLSAEVRKLKAKGYSDSAIGRVIGKNESSVRLLLNDALRVKNDAIAINAQILKDAVASKKYIDIGKGTEQYMGITAAKLKNAVAALEEDGYVVYPNIPVEQLTTGKETNIKVLAAPGTSWGEVVKNKYDIQMVTDVYSEDGGRTMERLGPPKNIDSSRVMVRYAEDGGKNKDGVIELRRGVDDISLGDAKYAQVRIGVDDSHYIKGMAIHSDDIPEGYDIVFNTNKHAGTPMLGPKDNTVLKPMGKDPENPFGASIKGDDKLIRAQRHYLDENGERQQSALNVVSEEGNWNDWSRNLSSQMLSKQNPVLAKKQLDLAVGIARDEFSEIMALTNPVVKADLLEKFASQRDADAIALKAAPLPGQTSKVILPVTSLPDNQIYAPGYNDGEILALIRHPHGGIFEIPVLTVNNKNNEAKRNIENALDAVGISPKVAERLSGADFDGDTVVVLPLKNVNIKSAPPLKDLENFDPKEAYPKSEGMRVMKDTPEDKGMQMGMASNLITDMTLKGAPPEELVRAVRHSMVVIDAAKHELDYKRSELDNNIAQLKLKYQGGERAGASTLISRSKSVQYVDERKEKLTSKMTPEEKSRWDAGEIIYEDTGRTYKKGFKKADGTIEYREMPRKQETTRMAEAKDASQLLSESPTKMELVYSEYANSMKAMGNQARKEARTIQETPYSPSARIAYKAEYESLNAALSNALRNAPLERQAQLIANKSFTTKRKNDPSLTPDQLKKLRTNELDDARKRIGAKKEVIYITDREWEAINAGAVHKTFLKTILANANPKRVRELATPRTTKLMSPGKVARAKSMLDRGYTQADIARALDVSVSTLIDAIQ